MAEIVLGIGVSHSTQVSLDPELWTVHAQIDITRTDYDALLTANAGRFGDAELSAATWAAKHTSCTQAIEALTDELARARADVIVVVGDDQREMFLEDTIPTFAVYAGTVAIDLPPDPQSLAPSRKATMWAYHGDQREALPCDAPLGRHLVAELNGAGFDVAHCPGQVEGRSLGHAFTFVRRRLMGPTPIPLVPVLVNTYYPPNQPAAHRCVDFGRALGDALASWPAEVRVVVVASGGLSHFVVDEELDRAVLDALERSDLSALAALPADALQSGSSEILNWVVVGSALRDLAFTTHTYVPGYRSPAGTGCGMAFGTWQRRGGEAA